MMDVLSLIYSFIFYFLGPLMWFREHKASTWLLTCPFWRNTKDNDIMPKHFVNGRMCYYDIKLKYLLLVWANNFSLVCAFKIEDIRDYVISLFLVLFFMFCFSSPFCDEILSHAIQHHNMVWHAIYYTI